MGFLAAGLLISEEDGCSLTEREQAQIRRQICTPIGQESGPVPILPEETPCSCYSPLFARVRPASLHRKQQIGPLCGKTRRLVVQRQVENLLELDDIVDLRAHCDVADAIKHE